MELRRYRVKAAVRGETGTALYGNVSYNFKAGPITPKSEQEQAALDHLVAMEQAEVIGEDKPDAAE